MEWTWDGFIAEEAKRTVQTTFLAACARDAGRTRIDRRLANRLAGVYLRLWALRPEVLATYGPPPADGVAGGAPVSVQVAAAALAAPASYRRVAEAWDGAPWIERRVAALSVRRAEFADFALREPRLIRPLPGREGEATWTDERRVRDLLADEEGWLRAILADPSRRARD